MDEEYDVVILGTGLKECVISGICSSKGKKVLHMDRNDRYGGDTASLNIDELYKHFDMPESPPSTFGKARDWNVDLIPKFLMADGKLVKLLISTGVTRYLEFKCADGSYVIKDNKVIKVPSNEKEALGFGAIGILEKNRFRKFLMYVSNYALDGPTAAKDNETMAELYKRHGLAESTQNVAGHAMALYRNDEYLSKPAKETIARIQLYSNSLSRYGKSPYLYPMYGLAELPQGFARLSAVYGGTYMLHKPIEKVEKLEDGKIGITSEGETVKAGMVVGDPSYFPHKVKSVGKIIRAICILSHPIPNTNNSTSCQIIIPQKEVRRTHDIYILSISSHHNVCSAGKYLALVSTTVETDNPKAEIQPGLNLLGAIDQKFYQTYDYYEPTGDGREDKFFVTKSYDATTHFETTCDDIIDLYKRMTGEEFNFDLLKSELQQEE